LACRSLSSPLLSVRCRLVSSGFQREYTAAEVAQHNKDDDCWMIIHGKVYDCNDFLVDHPGQKQTHESASGSGNVTTAVAHSHAAR
jgi:cytochrome b involved in lipid metabolism